MPPMQSNGENDPLDYEARLEGLITLIDQSHATDSEKGAVKIALGRILHSLNNRIEAAIDARRARSK